MSSSLAQGTLVTIITEAVLQDRLIQLLTKFTVSGYTITPAQGAGSHGKRMGDMAGYNTNIEVKTIVNPEISDQLLEQLKLFPANHALIAFRQTVEGLFD
jgi:nitrogen regulatory protein PII